MKISFVLAVSLAGLGSNIAFRLLDPLVPDIAGSFNLSIPTVASLITAYALPYAISQPFLGPIGDAVGKGLVIRTSLVVLATGLLLCAFAPNYTALVWGRVLCGFAAGGIIPAAMAMIGDRIPMADRQVAIGRFLLLIFIAQIAGAGGAGLLAGFVGWRGVLVFAAIVTGTVALVTFRTFEPRKGIVRPKPSLSHAKEQYRSVFANKKAIPLFILVLLEGASVFATHPYVAAVIGQRQDAGAFEAGLIIGAFGVGALLYTFSVGYLVRVLGPGKMAIIGAFSCAVMLATFAISPLWQIDIGLFLVFGFTFLMMHNSLQTVATELSTVARGSAVALFALSLFVGQAIGPPLFGVAAGFLGRTPVIFIEAAIVASLGILCWFLIFREDRKEISTQSGKN